MDFYGIMLDAMIIIIIIIIICCYDFFLCSYEIEISKIF